jgi:hypothetical protein
VEEETPIYHPTKKDPTNPAESFVDLVVMVPLVESLEDELPWRLAWVVLVPWGVGSPRCCGARPTLCEGITASTGLVSGEKGTPLWGFLRKRVKPMWLLNLRGPHLLNADALSFMGETAVKQIASPPLPPGQWRRTKKN